MSGPRIKRQKTKLILLYRFEIVGKKKSCSFAGQKAHQTTRCLVYAACAVDVREVVVHIIRILIIILQQLEQNLIQEKAAQIAL